MDNISPSAAMGLLHRKPFMDATDHCLSDIVHSWVLPGRRASKGESNKNNEHGKGNPTLPAKTKPAPQ